MRLRLFPSLALITALLTVALIVIGAVVRVSDSGLGCGNSWPLCNGTIFPPLDNINAWIEWSHRLVAMLIGVFGILMLIVAVRDYRKQKRGVLVATIVAAVMYAAQAGLGAVVVKQDLDPALVTVHLGTAMLLLAGLLVAAILSTHTTRERHTRDRFTALAYLTTALALVIILIGATVRGSGATLACLDWPLCNGALLPVNQGSLAMIDMLHRYAVAALGVSLLLLVWSAWTMRAGQSRRLALLALVLYLIQAAIGALVVLSGAAPVWGAAHVGFAATTWAVLIGFSVIETLDTAERWEGEWRAQSEPLLS